MFESVWLCNIWLHVHAAEKDQKITQRSAGWVEKHDFTAGYESLPQRRHQSDLST